MHRSLNRSLHHSLHGSLHSFHRLFVCWTKYFCRLITEYTPHGHRIWIKRREEFQHKKEKEDVPVVGYRDYVPEKKDSDKIETLDEVINRLNLIIRQGKFEGRILSVECLPCESTGDLRFDPEVWIQSLFYLCDNRIDKQNNETKRFDFLY